MLQIRVPDAEDPNDAAAADHKRKGDVAFVAKRYQEALQAYSQSLRHKTSNVVVWANRSAVYLRLKNPLAALEDARRARTLDETYTKVTTANNSKEGSTLLLDKETYRMCLGPVSDWQIRLT